MTSQITWYAARASGIVAWALAAASVVWGLALSTRALGRTPRPAWLFDLHRFLGGIALAFTAGVATLRLQDELRLSAEARRPGNPLISRQVRVYYTRSAMQGGDGERTADYKLDIRPQGGGDLQREAHLTLARQDDGTWRVVRFHETQPSR